MHFCAFVSAFASINQTQRHAHTQRERERVGERERYGESGIEICMFHSKVETKWSARTIDKFANIHNIHAVYMRVLKQKLSNCK